MTIASTLLDMLGSVAATGAELEFLGSIGTAPVLIQQMTVGGT